VLSKNVNLKIFSATICFTRVLHVLTVRNERQSDRPRWRISFVTKYNHTKILNNQTEQSRCDILETDSRVVKKESCKQNATLMCAAK